MDTSADRDLGVLVIRTIHESNGNRPIVVEVLEVAASGCDRVIVVTSSALLATRAVRDWLDAQDHARVTPARREGASRVGSVSADSVRIS